MESDPKISIVTAYYNRKTLFLRTLKSIEEQISDNLKGLVEVIVVDDGSAEEERLEGLEKEYSFTLKVIRLDSEDKWYSNPCIPFNAGFKEARGDIVIIQNPECCHVGNLLEFAVANTTEDNYLSFSCWALSKEDTENFGEKDIVLTDEKSTSELYPGWYNHPKFNARGYHFASAIKKSNLDKLGGFDEAYAKGIAFDDDEFIYRIAKNLNLNVVICPPTNPFVLHQNHYDEESAHNKTRHVGQMEKLWRNRNLYARLKGDNRPKKIKNKAKEFKRIPKIAHFYWEGDKFSYLHFLSVKSFLDRNPKWEAIMHTNRVEKKTDENAWATQEQKAVYTGKNYFPKLEELDIQINEIDFSDLGVNPDAHPVHKSDILRWHLLGTVGGVWVDSDILHLKPIEHLSKYIHKSCEGAVCWTTNPVPHYIIGFFMSKPNNPFFQKLFDESLKQKEIDYQMYGNKLIAEHFNTFMDIVSTFPALNIKNFHFEHFYTHPWFEVDQLFEERHEKFKEDHVVGVHWYNGDPRATEFYNRFDESYNMENPKTTIEEIIYECTKTHS